MRRPSPNGLSFSFILSCLLPFLNPRSRLHRLLHDEVVEISPHNRPVPYLTQICLEGSDEQKAHMPRTTWLSKAWLGSKSKNWATFTGSPPAHTFGRGSCSFSRINT